VKTLSVTEFKANCLRFLAAVEETGEPLLLTKRGRPLARILPAGDGKEAGWLGMMEGTAEIAGDLVEPATSGQDWNVLKP